MLHACEILFSGCVRARILAQPNKANALCKEHHLIALLLAAFAGPVAFLAAVLALVLPGGRSPWLAAGARTTVVAPSLTPGRLAAVAVGARTLARETVLVACCWSSWTVVDYGSARAPPPP